MNKYVVGLQFKAVENSPEKRKGKELLSGLGCRCEENDKMGCEGVDMKWGGSVYVTVVGCCEYGTEP